MTCFGRGTTGACARRSLSALRLPRGLVDPLPTRRRRQRRVLVPIIALRSPPTPLLILYAADTNAPRRHLRSARHGAPAESFVIAHALARAASTEQHVAVPARCVDAAARLEWAAAAFGLGSALWVVGVFGAAICVCSAATRRRRITLGE